jgi:NAD(P)-dependent dehydrogenase (short-subunit alcohol dehydrogenase family)
MGDRLKGKAALVTGAGQGIGRAIALRFAAEGAQVLVSDINRATAEAVANEIGAAAKPDVIDTSDEAQVKAAIAAAAAAFGSIDIIVNNAGVAGGVDWDKTIAINLNGVMYGLKHGCEALAARNGGSVISLSSMLGLISVPFPGVEAYTASKHGVVGLTKHYATNYGRRGVRVNCINPGWIRTAMTDPLTQSPQLVEYMERDSALGRMGTPEEVAETVLYLASDQSAFVTGIGLIIDGGRLAT